MERTVEKTSIPLRSMSEYTFGLADVTHTRVSHLEFSIMELSEEL